MAMKPETRGVLLSITASSLFAAMPPYVLLLPPTPGYALLAHRILWSVLIMALGLALTGQLKSALAPLGSRALPSLIFTSSIIGFQMWLFIWAPLQGRALELSLGYFLLPLVMVGVGRILFKERLRPVQCLAIGAATLGVAGAYVHAGGLSWVVLSVALGFPFYYVTRRNQPLAPLTAFFLENIIMLPLAVPTILKVSQVPHPFAFPPMELAGFAGLALLGTVPVLCMLSAGRILPLSLFGLLSYLEPALIFLVTLIVLKESIPPEELFTYGAILTALGFLALDGVLKQRESRIQNPSPTLDDSMVN
ncbi:MAG: EamA family transporter RarD [Desulfobacterales bacterium]|nr:EamA family transporter RarD [Desulfobacterales bacterium]